MNAILVFDPSNDLLFANSNKLFRKRLLKYAQTNGLLDDDDDDDDEDEDEDVNDHDCDGYCDDRCSKTKIIIQQRRIQKRKTHAKLATSKHYHRAQHLNHSSSGGSTCEMNEQQDRLHQSSCALSTRRHRNRSSARETTRETRSSFFDDTSQHYLEILMLLLTPYVASLRLNELTRNNKMISTTKMPVECLQDCQVVFCELDEFVFVHLQEFIQVSSFKMRLMQKRCDWFARLALFLFGHALNGLRRPTGEADANQRPKRVDQAQVLRQLYRVWLLNQFEAQFLVEANERLIVSKEIVHLCQRALKDLTVHLRSPDFNQRLINDFTSKQPEIAPAKPREQCTSRLRANETLVHSLLYSDTKLVSRFSCRNGQPLGQDDMIIILLLLKAQLDYCNYSHASRLSRAYSSNEDFGDNLSFAGDLLDEEDDDFDSGNYTNNHCDHCPRQTATKRRPNASSNSLNRKRKSHSRVTSGTSNDDEADYNYPSNYNADKRTYRIRCKPRSLHPGRCTCAGASSAAASGASRGRRVPLPDSFTVYLSSQTGGSTRVPHMIRFVVLTSGLTLVLISELSSAYLSKHFSRLLRLTTDLARTSSAETSNSLSSIRLNQLAVANECISAVKSYFNNNYAADATTCVDIAVSAAADKATDIETGGEDYVAASWLSSISIGASNTQQQQQQPKSSGYYMNDNLKNQDGNIRASKTKNLIEKTPSKMVPATQPKSFFGSLLDRCVTPLRVASGNVNHSGRICPEREDAICDKPRCQSNRRRRSADAQSELAETAIAKKSQHLLLDHCGDPSQVDYDQDINCNTGGSTGVARDTAATSSRDFRLWCHLLRKLDELATDNVQTYMRQTFRLQINIQQREALLSECSQVLRDSMNEFILNKQLRLLNEPPGGVYVQQQAMLIDEARLFVKEQLGDYMDYLAIKSQCDVTLGAPLTHDMPAISSFIYIDRYRQQLVSVVASAAEVDAANEAISEIATKKTVMKLADPHATAAAAAASTQSSSSSLLRNTAPESTTNAAAASAMNVCSSSQVAASPAQHKRSRIQQQQQQQRRRRPANDHSRGGNCCRHCHCSYLAAAGAACGYSSQTAASILQQHQHTGLSLIDCEQTIMEADLTTATTSGCCGSSDQTNRTNTTGASSSSFDASSDLDDDYDRISDTDSSSSKGLADESGSNEDLRDPSVVDPLRTGSRRRETVAAKSGDKDCSSATPSANPTSEQQQQRASTGNLQARSNDETTSDTPLNPLNPSATAAAAKSTLELSRDSDATWPHLGGSHGLDSRTKEYKSITDLIEQMAPFQAAASSKQDQDDKLVSDKLQADFVELTKKHVEQSNRKPLDPNLDLIAKPSPERSKQTAAKLSRQFKSLPNVVCDDFFTKYSQNVLGNQSSQVDFCKAPVSAPANDTADRKCARNLVTVECKLKELNTYSVANQRKLVRVCEETLTFDGENEDAEANEDNDENLEDECLEDFGSFMRKQVSSGPTGSGRLRRGRSERKHGRRHLHEKHFHRKTREQKDRSRDLRCSVESEEDKVHCYELFVVHRANLLVHRSQVTAEAERLVERVSRLIQ